MFLGKIWITALSTAGAFVYLRTTSDARLWFLPLIVLTSYPFSLLNCQLIAFAAFFIASCFMLVYDMTVSALLFCFLEDTYRNKPEDRHMSKSLEAFASDSGGLKCCWCC